MDFFSLYFISFLIIVFIVNWAIKPSVRYIWLLASSMFFYATWDIRYTALLLFVILDSYFLSLLISKHKNKMHSATPGGHGCGLRTATGRSQNGQLAV